MIAIKTYIIVTTHDNHEIKANSLREAIEIANTDYLGIWTSVRELII